MWILAALFLIGAATCYPGRHNVVTARICGGAGFAASLAMVVAAMMDPRVTGSNPNQEAMHQAMGTAWIFVVVGIPAAYAAVTGRLPRWHGQLQEAAGEHRQEFISRLLRR